MELRIKEAIRRARNFSRVLSTIVIEAETGTGKEMFAQSIHLSSPRADGPFVAVNCAALPETLLESELFGYAPGAFTGAKQTGKPGLFELAHGGTILLDEIGETSTALQARMLRVLQEKEVMRVGGSKVMPVDVRIIAATNRNLADLMRQGAFREDLFFRLSVLNLRIPPLRERKEDIPHLVNRFISAASERLGIARRAISSEALSILLAYDWPGNVRQLENACEQLLVISCSDEISRDEAEEIISRVPSASSSLARYRRQVPPTLQTLDEIERAAIINALEESGWNKSAAARRLGISKATLFRKLKLLDVSLSH